MRLLVVCALSLASLSVVVAIPAGEAEKVAREAQRHERTAEKDTKAQAKQQEKDAKNAAQAARAAEAQAKLTQRNAEKEAVKVAKEADRDAREAANKARHQAQQVAKEGKQVEKEGDHIEKVAVRQARVEYKEEKSPMNTKNVDIKIKNILRKQAMFQSYLAHHGCTCENGRAASPWPTNGEEVCPTAQAHYCVECDTENEYELDTNTHMCNHDPWIEATPGIAYPYTGSGPDNIYQQGIRTWPEFEVGFRIKINGLGNRNVWRGILHTGITYSSALDSRRMRWPDFYFLPGTDYTIRTCHRCYYSNHHSASTSPETCVNIETNWAVGEEHEVYARQYEDSSSSSGSTIQYWIDGVSVATMTGSVCNMNNPHSYYIMRVGPNPELSPYAADVELKKIIYREKKCPSGEHFDDSQWDGGCLSGDP